MFVATYSNKAVDIIITDLAVFAFPNGNLTLIDLMPGATLEQVKSGTTAGFDIALQMPT